MLSYKNIKSIGKFSYFFFYNLIINNYLTNLSLSKMIFSEICIN